MKVVLVIGSANMDYTVYVNQFPKNGETLLGISRNVQPGGKGENQAAALGKSNRVVCNFIGAVGNDNDGLAIKKVLSDNNVHTYLKTIDNVETGNATIVVDSSSENKIIVVPGANNELYPEDIDLKLLDNCDYVVLQNEIKQETNEFIIKEAHQRGKIVVYNPAPFRNVDGSIFAYLDYFTPNKGELANYAKTSDPLEGAKQLLAKGVKNVLVTLGTDGSMLVNKDGVIKVPAHKVKAVDTVAAGDTYVGYLVASLASGLSIQEAMEKASLASSITVSRKGSVISIPNGKEVY